ncbi:hypothetical protein L218DRAFT_992422, partial [Marasmius fiardii PR-910]
MTTTAKVYYVFAELKRHRVVQHSTRRPAVFVSSRITSQGEFWQYMLTQRAGLVDFVVLIPPTLVLRRAFDNGFSRAVQDLPDVDHDGQWKRWDDSDSSLPPEVLEECVLFVVPWEDYSKLSEERDYLGELREDNFKKRQTVREAPSTGAQPSIFAQAQSRAPLDFGRPLRSDRRPIPLCLLQKEFGEFQDNLRSAQLDPTLSKRGYESLSNLSQIFGTEAARETQFLDFLQQLLGSGVVIKSCPIGKCTTDGMSNGKRLL